MVDRGAPYRALARSRCMAARKSLAGAVFFTGTFRALQYPIPAATLTVRVDSATITVMAVSFTLLKDNKEVCK
jgi:hypothetical protein